jgi:hypothetical protein
LNNTSMKSHSAIRFRNVLLTCCSATLWGSPPASGQIQVTDLSTLTPQALAQEIAGNGMTISNVQFNQPGATAAAANSAAATGSSVSAQE